MQHESSSDESICIVTIRISLTLYNAETTNRYFRSNQLRLYARVDPIASYLECYIRIVAFAPSLQRTSFYGVIELLPCQAFYSHDTY